MFVIISDIGIESGTSTVIKSSPDWKTKRSVFVSPVRPVFDKYPFILLMFPCVKFKL